MAEHATHLTSATDNGRPSIFEVLAQENLMMTIRPAGKHAVGVLAESHPPHFGWFLKWYEEIYTLLDFVVQHHYLSRYNASFAENFYDLKRACLENGSSQQLGRGLKWRALVLLVFVPYLKQKLDQAFENLKYREANLPRRENISLKMKVSRTFLALYPYLHLLWEGTSLYYMLAYTFKYSRWHSLLLKLSKMELRHNMDEQNSDRVQAAWEDAKALCWGQGVTRGVLQGMASVLSTGLSVGMFFLQFLDWWYNSDSNAPVLTALPTPQPLQMDNTHMPVPYNCPLCLRLRTNETALSVSGYVFCFPCIYEYIQKQSCCPITGYPAKMEHLIKIYQPYS